MDQLTAIILAAGEGKRMKSKNSKVMNKICGEPMIRWIIRAADEAGIKDKIVVVGHRADQVKEYLGDSVKYADQVNQLGTGHAVMQAQGLLKDVDGYVFILYGDTPLVTSDTILNTIEYHKSGNYAATLITAELSNPAGYGRVIRNSFGDVQKIVEERDASPVEKEISEINAGMYCFSTRLLLEALDSLDNNNEQGEYYLTDTIEILIKKGYRLGAFKCGADEIPGVNDRVQLNEASSILRSKILNKLMKSGVTIIDPMSTFIDCDVEIGIDTVIYPGSILEGGTVIGEDCVIGPNSRIVSTKIGNNVEVINSVVLQSSIDDDTHVGPFAFIRPDSCIGKDVKIGDFVEIKKSIIGDRTKISHLTYVGDSEVGLNCNLGCGVVTVNYNGKTKNKTIIEDNAFVGCNTNLIAPVRVKKNTYIAAGSTITDEVPENALAIARERQVNKEDWVIRKGMLRND